MLYQAREVLKLWHWARGDEGAGSLLPQAESKELMQKGYGMGSGISLFIATNICESHLGARTDVNGIFWPGWQYLDSRHPGMKVEKSEDGALQERS